MRSQTLLERLANPRTADRTIVQDRAALIRSILANVQNLLNTRQGSAAAQMDLGLPAPHEMLQGMPATIGGAEKIIRTCISTFEPRLTGVVVEHVPQAEGSLELRFAIRGRLNDGSKEEINFSTAIGRDGRIRLRDA